jgi:hypothetical protein
MDESCRRLHGVYDSYDYACSICRMLVEDSVRELFDYAKKYIHRLVELKPFLD